MIRFGIAVRASKPFRCMRRIPFASIFWLMLGLLLMGSRCQGQLPEGWSNLDIGSPGVAGSASYNAGIWTVEGGGSDIWGTYDQFHFVCRLSGPEAEIMARKGHVGHILGDVCIVTEGDPESVTGLPLEVTVV